ncbi:hypothetical protein MLD38_027962 [Melastoma candidum]|uniref:Uncharacterized protein n=1 Tax=Melastoma candidum TaxID=119954 RepID=A0ACB9MZF4_9MYRT|nr:hypothetical protein MLD38_027962 [Melastoma candidum]
MLSTNVLNVLLSLLLSSDETGSTKSISPSANLFYLNLPQFSTNPSIPSTKTMEDNKVIFHGLWASPYVKRVEFALKLKGVGYEYVEEDLRNKSPSLLQLNPIYKKVPVLVHDGKPVIESLIILEYIDETWKDHGPRLLPEDPFERYRVRFWADFFDREVMDALMGMNSGPGEERKAATEQVREKIAILEEGVKSMLQAGHQFIGGDTPAFLDIVIWSIFSPYEIHREVMGYSLIGAETCPVITSLVDAISEHPLGKASAFPREKLGRFLLSIKQNGIKFDEN